MTRTRPLHATVPARCRMPGRAPRAQAGFTLVELLVVLVLLGVLGSAVALTLPTTASPLQRQSEALALQLARARDEAIIATRPVRLLLDGEGYRFERRDFEHWQQIDVATLHGQSWPAGVQPALPGDAPLVLQWDAMGNPDSPLVLALAAEGMQTRVQVLGDGSVRIDGPR